jgi:hypothetical protein
VTRISSPFWIPGHDKVWLGFTPTLGDDDWAYLYHGAILSITASSPCAQDPSNALQQGPVVGPFEDLPVK